MMHPVWMTAVVLGLWSVPLAAMVVPKACRALADFWRGESQRDKGAVTVFLLAALAVSFYAFPSSAEKGGGTTNAPAVVSTKKIINLYYQDSTGRLIPLNARIEEKK